jgi:hypothetical protein
MEDGQAFHFQQEGVQELSRRIAIYWQLADKIGNNLPVGFLIAAACQVSCEGNPWLNKHSLKRKTALASLAQISHVTLWNCVPY